MYTKEFFIIIFFFSVGEEGELHILKLLLKTSISSVLKSLNNTY